MDNKIKYTVTTLTDEQLSCDTDLKNKRVEDILYLLASLSVHISSDRKTAIPQHAVQWVRLDE